MAASIVIIGVWAVFVRVIVEQSRTQELKFKKRARHARRAS